MKVKSKAIKAAMSTVARFVKRGPVEITSCVVMRASGGSLTLEAGGPYADISMRINCEGDLPESAVQADVLAKLLARVDSDYVEIAQTARALAIKGGAARGNLNKINTDGRMRIIDTAEGEPVFHVRAPVLVGPSIEAVRWAAQVKGAANPVFKGVNIIHSDGSVEWCCVSGIAISRRIRPVDCGGGDGHVTIDQPSAQMLASAIDMSDEIIASTRRVVFKSLNDDSSVMVSMPLLASGKGHPIKTMPQVPGEPVRLPSQALLDAIRACDVVAGRGGQQVSIKTAIKLAYQGGDEMVLSASSADGDVEAGVPIQSDGPCEPFEFYANPGNLLSAASLMTARDDVELTPHTGRSPGFLLTSGDTSCMMSIVKG